MTSPSVTAIIPVHNGTNYVSEAIESCFAQTCPLAEIIVVDDGSTDRTAEIVAGLAPRVNLIKQQRGGHGAALTKGIESARSEFVAFLDHDDVWEPEKTALQLRAMEAQPELEAVFGHVRQFISTELQAELSAKIQVPDSPQPGIQISAMMIRKSAFARLGLFDSGRNAFAFPNWYARAVNLSLKSKMLPETVSRRRIHQTNYTRSDREDYHQELLSFARNAAAMRRGNPTK